MSEQVDQSVGMAEMEAQSGPSAGTLLRQAREAAGLHVAALAASLKVPVQKLEALEADRMDLLPDAVFARALAASVCRTLKLDPAPVLDKLPSVVRRVAVNVSGINAPFRAAPGRGTGTSVFQRLTRPLALAVGALLLGALVLILLPAVQPLSVKWSLGTSDVAKVSGADGAVPKARNGIVNEPVVQAFPPGPSEIAKPEVVPAPVERIEAAASAASAVPASVSAPLARASSESPQPSASGIVAFKTTAPSWVEVSGADGVKVLRKLMVAGESTSISGTVPLSVVVGSADVTRVEVRGQPFDLKAITRDNVARFEVK